jgi:AcrR family transcriptional regulator
MAKLLVNYEKQLADAKMPAGKKKVLTTALKLFAEKGFHATTTALIAKRAGVSEGTIYKYFSSKDELLSKLLQPILTDIKNSFFSNLDKEKDLPTLVHFIVTDRISFIQANFDFIKVIFQGILTNEPDYEDYLTGPDGILKVLADLQARYPEINQNLSQTQLARIFMGPILVYVLQSKLLGLPVEDNDLDLIEKEILLTLTAK